MDALQKHTFVDDTASRSIADMNRKGKTCAPLDYVEVTTEWHS